jgi:hypothetical protein
MSAGFWDRRAFSIANGSFTWIDVVFAAMARGEWSAFERRLAEGLACAARADADDVSPSDEALDEAATAYRRPRALTGSFMHMHAMRMLRSAAKRHEM